MMFNVGDKVRAVKLKEIYKDLEGKDLTVVGVYNLPDSINQRLTVECEEAPNPRSARGVYYFKNYEVYGVPKYTYIELEVDLIKDKSFKDNCSQRLEQLRKVRNDIKAQIKELENEINRLTSNKESADKEIEFYKKVLMQLKG